MSQKNHSRHFVTSKLQFSRWFSVFWWVYFRMACYKTRPKFAIQVYKQTHLAWHTTNADVRRVAMCNVQMCAIYRTTCLHFGIHTVVQFVFSLNRNTHTNSLQRLWRTFLRYGVICVKHTEPKKRRGNSSTPGDMQLQTFSTLYIDTHSCSVWPTIWIGV